MMVRLRSEDGVTLVTAILTFAIVVSLATTAVGIAMHSSTSSGYDRKRVQAIAVAEAGIDYYFSYLQSTGGVNPQCSITRQTTSSPPGSFTVTATFYDSFGSPLPCPLPANVIPTAVKLRSVGQSSAASPTRVMEAYAGLTKTTGYTFDNAGSVFGNNNITLLATAQVGGDFYSDADVYSNGDIRLSSNSTLYGKVYAQGTVWLGSGAEIKRDVWANGSISMVGNGRIRGNAISASSSISLESQSRIYGDARAGTTNPGGTVDGYRTANSPSPPPPARPFPNFTFNQSQWEASPYNYTVRTEDCTTLKTFLTGAGYTGGNYVLRVPTACEISFESQTTYPVKGNLAIIADGSVTMNDGARFSATGGPWNLFLFTGLGQAAGCSFTTQPNSGADPGLKTLIYVPASCTITLKSSSSLIEGQVLGGEVVFRNPLVVQYTPLEVPGSGVAGFKQDVRYKREVV